MMPKYQQEMMNAVMNKKFKVDLHSRRSTRSLSSLMVIKYCLATNKKLAIGTSNMDALYSQVKLMYPEAKLTKMSGYLLVESE